MARLPLDRFCYPMLVLPVLLVLLPRCKGASKKRAPKKIPVGVTLLTPGDEPRTRLRYRFRTGETLSYRMTSRRRLTGQPGTAPPVMVRLSMFTERVHKRQARIRWRVERVSAGSPVLKGRTLYVDTTDRGEISTVTRHRQSPAAKAPLKQSVRQLFLSWPTEAVGPGARWTQASEVILAPTTKGGIRTRVEARYRFERVAPCGQSRCAHLSVRMKMKLRHRAGLVKVRGEGTGSGQVVFDLRRGWLLESHTRAEIGMSSSLQPGKVVQTLTLKQSIALTR